MAWIEHDGRRGTRRRYPMTVFAKLLVAVAIVAVVRVTLVDNPWVWSLYGRVLDPDRIGWRQDSALRTRIDSYRDLPSPVRYLAVGSSQTQAIYGLHARQHPELGVFDLAAMGPFDFVTHLEHIERYRPDVILLYLSDFEIARRPERAALVLAPEQRLGAPALWRDLLAVPAEWDTAPLLAEMVVGEILPEFKFRFVFRGLVDETFRRVAIRMGTPPPRAPREPEEERIRMLRESIDPRHADFNLFFLDRFLEATQRRGLPVVIVEGQYNPVVLTAEILVTRAWVGERLALLADQYEHVRFLDGDQIPALEAADYGDLTHVTPEAGVNFASAVLRRVDEEGVARRDRR